MTKTWAKQTGSCFKPAWGCFFVFSWSHHVSVSSRSKARYFCSISCFLCVKMLSRMLSKMLSKSCVNLERRPFASHDSWRRTNIPTPHKRTTRTTHRLAGCHRDPAPDKRTRTDGWIVQCIWPLQISWLFGFRLSIAADWRKLRCWSIDGWFQGSQGVKSSTS